jgi:hypothetical protein
MYPDTEQDMLSTPARSELPSWGKNEVQNCHNMVGQEKATVVMSIVQELKRS